MKRLTLAVLLAITSSTGYVHAQEAGITRVVIDSRESPAFKGRSFGSVGQYEILKGRAFGEVDPKHPGNVGIVYIDKAPVNARGRVEYDIDLVIVKPIDMTKGNNTLFYGVNNRGREPFNLEADDFPMQHGFTVVWSGWHADVPKDAIRARFPTPKNADGTPIRKWITNEIGVGELGIGFPPIYTASPVRPYLDDFYPAVAESMPGAVLMRRRGPHGEAEVIPRNQWSFADCPKGGTGTPSNMSICLPAGFSGDYIYQLIYEAQDPRIQGLGLAATRDIVSYLRHNASPSNPLVTGGRNPIRWTMAFGASQSGRYLRHLLYEGFNADINGQPVFDGLMPHIAGGRRGNFNTEFAQTTRYSRSAEEHFFPEDGFPFTYETLTDPITGKTDGLLAKCRLSNTCPKIFQSDDSTEFWQARSSLVLTDPLGKKDVPLPENVRFYLNSSTSHGPAPNPEDRGMCQFLRNPNRNQETLSALYSALQAWISTGKEPPPSRYPRISDGTLVPALDVRFPTFPGIMFTAQFNHKLVNDYSVLPPRHVPGTEYGVLVPQVDADGNDIAGVRSAGLQTPTATYTGWNLRRAGLMEGLLCGIDGSSAPFAKTAAERGTDPRLSLQERYKTHQGYVDAFKKSADALMKDGFLLQEDYDWLIADAEKKETSLPR